MFPPGRRLTLRDGEEGSAGGGARALVIAEHDGVVLLGGGVEWFSEDLLTQALHWALATRGRWPEAVLKTQVCV